MTFTIIQRADDDFGIHEEKRGYIARRKYLHIVLAWQVAREKQGHVVFHQIETKRKTKSYRADYVTEAEVIGEPKEIFQGFDTARWKNVSASEYACMHRIERTAYDEWRARKRATRFGDHMTATEVEEIRRRQQSEFSWTRMQEAMDREMKARWDAQRDKERHAYSNDQPFMDYLRLRIITRFGTLENFNSQTESARKAFVEDMKFRYDYIGTKR